MIRGMGIKIQDAFNGPFRKKKPATTKAAKPREVESLVSDVRIRYLSSRQLDEAAQAERYLLENLDNGTDFKNLYYLKHQFLIIELEQPSFCDLCGLLIWGVYRLSLKCRNCNLTCHPQCKQFLRLVCPKPRPEKLPLHVISSDENYAESVSSRETDDVEENLNCENRKDYESFSAKLVEEFNESFPFALLQLEPDGSYTGFIRIILRLKRPITVSNGPFPRARVTSFYLPRNSEKLIHVASIDRTPEVVSAILSKFRIRDDPRKFSLHLEERDGAKRLAQEEFPLRRVVKAREVSVECCRLILEETDPKNVLWDAFTLPELENFKLILDREEEEWIKLVQQNYALYRKHLADALVNAGSAAASLTP